MRTKAIKGKQKRAVKPGVKKRILSTLVAAVAIVVIALIGFGIDRKYATTAGKSSQVIVSETAQSSPSAEQCVADLPLNFLVGQVLMIGLSSDDMKLQTPMFKQYNIGGIAMMTSPANPYDGSISKFKAAAASLGVQPLVSTDEEGGNIQRFINLGALPAPAQVAATLTPAQAQSLISRHGLKLKSVGIDMVLGPLADVGPKNGPSVLENRVFSNNPEIVSSYDLAYINGWQAADIIPTLKHFPGLGSATANTDYSPSVTPPLSSLQQRDFIPYRQSVFKAPVVMVGNQSVPGWISGPASLSPKANQYLREVLGYKDSLIITDSLSAAAITSETAEPQAIAGAIMAGNDIALFVELPTSSFKDNQILVNQAEELIKESVTSGSLPKQQLVASVLRKLNAQHIQPCSINAP